MNCCRVGVRFLLLIAAIALGFTVGHGQSPYWLWAKGSVGTGQAEGWATACDTKGNVYVTGQYEYSISFGAITLPYSSLKQAFLVKYDSAGNVLWALASEGGHGANSSTWVATDTKKNVYITGAIDGSSATFGGDTITNNGSQTVFIAKCNSAGGLIWIKKFISTNASNPYSIAVTNNGRVYVAGNFNGTITAGAVTVTGSNVGSIFLACYDTAGNALWAKTAQTGSESIASFAYSVAADVQGNAYVTGYLGSSADTFGNITLSGGGSAPYFIAKYDTGGNAVWAKTTGGPGEARGNCIATDTLGHEYVTGLFLNYVTFGGVTLSTANVYDNFFIAKYDSAGNALWAKATYSTDYNEGYCVAVSPQGQVVVTGTPGSSNTISFDGTTLSFIPDYNQAIDDAMFLLCLNDSGNLMCGEAFKGGGDDQCGVCFDPAGNAYLGGDFYVSNFIVGPDTLSGSVLRETIFAAKFQCPACSAGPAGYPLNYLLSSSSLCHGDSALITFSGDSSVSILPGNYVTWLDSVHAVIKPDTTTAFMVSGYSPCGLHVSQAFTLVVNSDSVAISSTKAIICPGDTTQICAPAGFIRYNWSSGDTTPCINTLSAGNYNVTVTAADNCSATSNHVNISIYTPLPVTVSVSGDTLTGYSSNNYQWLLNGAPIPGAISQVYIASASGTYTLQVIDTNGCKALSIPIVITGIADEISENSFTIYPNPASTGWLLAVSPELLGGTAQVYDATGGLVFKSSIVNTTTQITIPNAASGVYELRITSEEYTVVRKLVKM